MSNNIVLLAGSPRAGANSDKLAEAFKNGAEAAGKHFKLFRVADMKIGSCIGCQSCLKNKGACFKKDDMQEIIEAIRVADAVVFASPIYFFAISAQLKLAIDRTYALLKEDIKVKRCALLLTCADHKNDEAEAGAVLSYQKMVSYKKWENAGIVVVTEVNDKNDIIGRPELEDAYNLGRRI